MLNLSICLIPICARRPHCSCISIVKSITCIYGGGRVGGGVCTLASTPEVGAKTSPLNGLVGNYNSNHLARTQIKQRQPKLHVGFTQKHQEIKCSFSIFNHLFILLFLYKIEQNTVTFSLRRTPLGPALSVRLREVSVLSRVN